MTQPAPLERVDILKMAGEKVEALGIDLASIPVPHLYVWQHAAGEFGKFRMFKPHPWDDKLTVCAMFHDEDKLTVYTVPTPGKEPDPEDPHPLRRFILYTRHAGYVVELLNLDPFIDAIADEMTIVAEGMTTADAERDRIVDYLRTKGWPVAADRIDELAHLEEEEPGLAPAPAPTVAPGNGVATPATE